MIETDVLVALASRTDRHHGEARRLLERLTAVKLSPYSLVELDLLIASQCLRVRLPDFYSALEEVLAYYGVEVLRPRPAHFEVAWASGGGMASRSSVACTPPRRLRRVRS
ncbi:MAG: hypothetical protein DRK00_10225, partial [Thermoprotei archaeon]